MDYGTHTCAGYPGSINYLEVDAKSLVKWNVNYVKMDGCYSQPNEMPLGFEKFSHLLNKTGVPIVFSCSYPAYVDWPKNHSLLDWERVGKNCNLWRMLEDVQDSWQSILNIIKSYRTYHLLFASLAGPGKWNDPDMLLLGNYGLSHNQERVQMGMWCMFAAPLIISTDLDTIDKISADLLKNKYLINIDQDSGGHQAEYVESKFNYFDYYSNRYIQVI